MIDGSLVEMIGVSKSYGSVTALEQVDLTVEAGEIVGLLGDNGAGKSTLIKILSGALAATKGELLFMGRPVRFRNTRDAIAAGIETIYQDSALVEQLSIDRNLFMGREPTRCLGPVCWLDVPYMERITGQLLRRAGITKEIIPATPINALSGGERQAIAIARAMFFEAALIVMDEPTNNLGVEETQSVMTFILEAREAGRSCILISHNIHNVLRVADRIVVLRRGRKVGELPRSDATVERVESLITGIDR